MIRMKRNADVGFLSWKGDMGGKMILRIGLELAKRIVNRGLNLILRRDVQEMMGA